MERLKHDATADDQSSSATTPDLEPGKRSGLKIDRKEGDAGSLSAGAAQASVEGAQAKSSGQALDGGVQGKMEGAYGADFSGVRVHTDGASGQAAGDLNARAFTAGSDIFFGEGEYDPDSEDGEHLIAHELAHVVQQGDGAKGTGDGMTISSSGDSSEVAADRAADAVVRGEPVPAVGSGPASMIHRDALGDLNSTSKGNWIGNVDEGEALKRLGRLTDAEKQSLVSDSSKHGIIERLCKAFNASEMMRMFAIVPQFDLRWRIYWLIRAGEIGSLSTAQWRGLAGFVMPADMDSLRAYPDGYRAFLRHAPALQIPPWDRLEGLENGNWHGSATEVRNAVEGLNPLQKATCIADDGKMTAIMKKAGETAEKYRTIQYLNPACKFKVYWLSVGNALAGLADNDWAELLAQASKTEYDELVAWKDGWKLVEKYAPPSVISITRSNAETAAAVNSMSDPVQVNAMFGSLGPAGFLAEATKGTAMEVSSNYTVIKNEGKVLPTVNGLQKGAKMGAQTKANLKQWFGIETDAATLEIMVGVRFNVAMSGDGSKDHEGGDDPATLAAWTVDSLRLCWTTLERLPPEQVEQNKRFRHLLRNSGANNGNAYFWGNDVVMGVGAGNDLTANTNPSTTQVYQAGGQEAGSPAVPVNKFNATLRHEIGHAVDAQLGIMNSIRSQENCGGWIKYDDYGDFVDAIIVNSGGMSGHGYPDEGKYKKAMKRAVSKTKDFLVALAEVGSISDLVWATTNQAIINTGPVARVWTTGLWTGQPWYDNSWIASNNRNFQRAYGDSSSLYSFRRDIRASRLLTSYQWRAPGEWFAEVYQVYYAEQETGPDVPVGGILRSKDSAAAAMMSNLVDRGYSPQDMRGGTTAKAPGTT